MTASTAFPGHHLYDIHGLVRLRSVVPLAELRFFEVRPTSAVEGSVDVEIETGGVGGRPRRRRTLEAIEGGIRYAEHGGRRSAAFELAFGPPLRLVVSPLLARSPHVLYTNVVEALIRYLLVERGHALVHAATVVLGARGVMITAQTDTGKTGTVLRLARERGACFLSDDMTVLSSDGKALAFPKPLTISAHTLRAVDASAGDGRRRASLAIKSRIHSRAGRSVGQRLSNRNVPIVSVNALMQIAVPPPKRMIRELVPGCAVTTSADITDLFVIARGPSALAPLSTAEVAAALAANTDDAYQFPPAAELMRRLVVGGRTHAEVRAREEALVAAAVAGLPARLVVCDDFTWADRLPQLVDAAGLVGPPA